MEVPKIEASSVPKTLSRKRGQELAPSPPRSRFAASPKTLSRKLGSNSPLSWPKVSAAGFSPGCSFGGLALRRSSERITSKRKLTVVNSPSQCAGLNRHEVGDERASRERTSDPLGPESCAVTARDAAKHRQGYRRGGYRVAKSPNQDADDMPRRGRQYGQGR